MLHTLSRFSGISRAQGVALSTCRTAYLILTVMIVVYVIGQGTVALRLHDAFVTSADDLSNIDQVVWNSQHGRLLERTDGTRSVPRYGEHLEPIWVALGLIYHFWDNVDALLLAQTVALALGALPVFWLARDVWGKAGPGRRGDYGAGLVFAAIYLLSPFVGRANSAEVHATPFAVAPLLLAIAWGWRGLWKRVAPLTILLLLIREDIGLLVMALGLWALLARRAFWPAISLFVAGLAGVWFSLFVVIAHFSDARFGGGRTQSIFFERYGTLGEGVSSVLIGLFTQPTAWISLLFDSWRVDFYRDFIMSTGGLVLAAPLAWVLFAPHLLLNLLSDYFAQAGALQHYGAPLVPGLMTSAILGGARLLQAGGSREWLRTSLLGLALAGALLTARIAGGQPLAQSWIQPPVGQHHQILYEVASVIPRFAPLSTDPQLHPHLAHRHDAYRFPDVGDNAEWVLVDVTTNTTLHPNDLRQELLRLLEGDWGIVDGRDGYLLLRRGVEHDALPERFFTFTHPVAPPEHPLRAQFGDAIEVVGYDLEQDFWGRVMVSWHLRPLKPLEPTFSIDGALLSSEGMPLADTSGQPLLLPLWLPLEQWQVGQTYLLRTLPREGAAPFWPALSVTQGGASLPPTVLPDPHSSARPRTAGAWLTAGQWTLDQNHAKKGDEGWRRWTPSVKLGQRQGDWPVARLGAWEIKRVGETIEVTLHWQAGRQAAAPIHRFIHLIPDSSEPPLPVAQADGVLGSTYPHTQWTPEEWIEEKVIVGLPRDTQGKLRLLVGLYDPTTGERVSVTPDSGGASFDLGILSTR